MPLWRAMDLSNALGSLGRGEHVVDATAYYGRVDVKTNEGDHVFYANMTADEAYERDQEDASE